MINFEIVMWVEFVIIVILFYVILYQNGYFDVLKRHSLCRS